MSSIPTGENPPGFLRPAPRREPNGHAGDWTFAAHDFVHPDDPGPDEDDLLPGPESESELVGQPRNLDGNDAFLLYGAESVRAAIGGARKMPPGEELESLDLAALAKLKAEPKEFTIERLAPLGETTLFTGPGSSGKSLLAQQFATASAAGIDCLGFRVTPGVALYVTCEDDAGQLHWRQEHICKALGVDLASLTDRLHLISLRGRLDNELVVESAKGGERQPSPAWRRLEAKIRSTGARLVWLDNVGHLFNGNENDRGEVTRFVNLLNRLAGETGAAIVLLGHPSKSRNPDETGHSYSGSTAWLNAVRSQFHVEHDEETEIRKLIVGKANYARKGEAVSFVWFDWAFVREEDLPSDYAAEMNANIRAASENKRFLECLAKTKEEKRAVSLSPSASNYAPRVFAKMTIGKGISEKGFAAALERLLHLGTIANDVQVYQRNNRAWVTGLGLTEVAPTLAPTPAQTMHEPCTDLHSGQA